MAIPNDPITREEQYLASMAGQEVDLPQPITRVEKYLAKASGMDVETPDPITREEKYLDAIAEGGGGSSVTVEPLTVTQNGTTTAPSGTAYSPVTTNVPNSYGASDEGKVVSNGALVAQTAHAPVTANGTIDTTLNNSVTVNVPASAPVLESLEVTENGTYTPDEGVDGFDEVVVDVEGGGGTVLVATKDQTIDPDYCVYQFPSGVLASGNYAIGANPAELARRGIFVSVTANNGTNGAMAISVNLTDRAFAFTELADNQVWFEISAKFPAGKFPDNLYAYPIA